MIALWTSLAVSLAVTADAAPAPDGKASLQRRVVAAAPGRIEGSAEPVAIGASISGIVESVTVRQGDRVSAGQVLVRIACRVLAAQLAQRGAEQAAATAFHDKLVNGPRPADIEIAEAELKLTEARLMEAQTRVARSSSLHDRNVVSLATRDADTRDAAVAAAQLDSSRLRLRLLREGTRAEELAEAKARMLAAEQAVEVTKSELSNCEIKSPVDGIVLRKHVSEGELISLFFPKPLITVSETRSYRVRAEVDEQDVPRVKQGQMVEIVVNAADKNRLRGRVAAIAPVMGRRQILTSDPADKSDRDVMEVMIDLESKPDHLPIGLRVSAIFLE
jgi:multidrug resistance efflux pump